MHIFFPQSPKILPRLVGLLRMTKEIFNEIHVPPIYPRGFKHPKWFCDRWILGHTLKIMGEKMIGLHLFTAYLVKIREIDSNLFILI